MSLNSSLHNGVNKSRTDDCEGLSPSRSPAGKQREPGCHQVAARKKWTNKENKTAISCYLKVTKESKGGYKRRMYNPWTEMGMFEIEVKNLTCQVRIIFKNKKLAKIEIKQLQKEIEKDETAPERVDIASEMNYGASSGTKLLENNAVI